ncbi:trypsin-like serine protease [Micromonospora sp. DT81.3]|uniref:trypsin-like serine protease n=1 Tax=Micromonospora sp. DT81.3 TaxID=3416523 RepID=UPI003CF63CAB
MLARFGRWVLAPLALAMTATALVATPAGAITGPNITEDFEHEYVGLVAFYDEDGVFLHRCSGTLLSPEVFLTAGHCVAGDDEGNVAASARIWFEQDAGADYDPATGTPATSGYPVSGGVTSTMLYNYGFTDLSTIPETQDVGLIVLEDGALEAVYPEIDTFGTLAPVGAADELGTGVDAVVTVSGYGVTRTNGKTGQNTVSYRERLMGETFIISTRNPDTAGYNLQLASNFGNGRVGTCFGDSGGPVFAGDTDTVLGVNSWVKNWSCGGQGFPYRVDTVEVQTWTESVLAPLGLWDDVAPE